MKRPVPMAAATLAAGFGPGADGFIRLPVSERDWICLAMGCAHGLQDLVALWTDAGSVQSLVDEMLKQSRYALLLRPQLVENLTVDQLIRTRAALRRHATIRHSTVRQIEPNQQRGCGTTTGHPGRLPAQPPERTSPCRRT